MTDMLGDDKKLLQESHIVEFLTKMWGGVPHDWAKKYWRGMNAFNTGHVGVSADDYVECWIKWDTDAFDFYNKQSNYRFNPDNPDKPKGADFAIKQQKIVKDVFNHWSKQSSKEQDDYSEFLSRFRET